MSKKDLGELRVKLTAATAEFGKKLSKARMRLEKFSKTSEKIAKRAAVGFAAMGAPLGYSIHLAGKMAEQINAMGLVFEKNTPKAEEWAKTTAREIGRSELEVQGFATSMQGMLSPMLGSAEAATDLSLKLTELAYDIASVRDVADEEAFRSLQAGMIGSLEPMLKFGVVMTQANLQAFALSQGIDKSVQSMSEAEKVALRYAFILEKTKTAQGDAANTSGSFANTMKAVKAEITNIAVEIGNILLPAATKILTAFKNLLRWFRDLDPSIKRTIVLVGVLTTAVTGLAAGLGGVGAILPTIIDGWASFGKGIAAATKFVWGLKAALWKTMAIASAALGVIGLTQLTTEALADPEGLRERLGIQGKDVGILDAAKMVFAESFKGGFETLFGPVGDVLNGVLDKVSGAMQPDELATSTKGLTSAFDALNKGVKATTKELTPDKFDFSDLSDELASEVGLIAQEGAFGFDFDQREIPAATEVELEKTMDEIAESIKPKPGFKDAMDTAFTEIQGSLGTFSELARAAEEGGKTGGIWGAIIAVVARLLQMTQFFQRVVGHFNVIVNTMVLFLDKLLAPLAAMTEVLTSALIVLANFTMQFTEVFSRVDLVTEVMGWAAEQMGNSVDWIVKWWNKMIDKLARLLGQLPDWLGGDKLQKLANKLKLDNLEQARTAYESMFGDGVGTGLTDLKDSFDGAAGAVNSFSESLTNVPEGYKVALARFNAMDPEAGLAAASTGASTPSLAAEFLGAAPTRTVNNEVHIYGVTDPEELYAEIKKLEEIDSFMTSGTTTRIGGTNSVVQPK